MKLIKCTLSVVVATLLSSIAIKPAFAVTSAVPTAGIAVTSFIVGGAGAVVGGGWKTRLGGFLVGVIDPVPATFLEGKIVIEYPEELLAVTGVGWFGNFAEDPSQPFPPAFSEPFFDLDPATALYDFMQPPNPVLTTSTSATGGVVTVEFDATPDGIIVDSGENFNLLSIMFQNISNQELLWNQADPPESANFFSISDEQILTCLPDPTVPVPVTCGVDDEPFTYTVTLVPVPESNSTLSFLVLGTFSVTTIIKRTLKRNRSVLY